MKKQLQIKALDVLIEHCIYYQKLELHRSFLEAIVDFHNTLYSTTEFLTILEEKILFYEQYFLNEEDSLFIDATHTPYSIKHHHISNSDEKTVLYALLHAWAYRHRFNDLAFLYDLHKGLDISEQIANKIQQLYFSEESLESEEHYMCVAPAEKKQEEQLEGLWIESNQPIHSTKKNQHYLEGINTLLHIIFIPEEKIFIIKHTNYQPATSCNEDLSCFVSRISPYCTKNAPPINYNILKQLLVKGQLKNSFSLVLNDLQYSYYNTKSLGNINLSCSPGELVGVLGEDGAGKSTLLKLIAGINTATRGNVCLNAYEVNKFKYQLSGLIAYIPEDDLLYNELSGRENIDYAIRLSHHKISDNDRLELLNRTLNEMQISDIADIKVGSTEQKLIQPYQRRLLNIALEIIRNPQILIIDNSKQGLGRNDATKVINVLTEYSLKGKLIITSIFETNNAAFSNFDSFILLDKTGTCRFNGNKSQFELFFQQFSSNSKTTTQKQALTSESVSELLNRISYQKSISTQNTEQSIRKEHSANLKKKTLPPSKNNTPRLEQQYISYTRRNFFTKIARKKELSYSIAAAPLMALFLALLLRHSPENSYTYALNENIPIYFYLSIVINVFLGLIQSAKEIITDRKNLIREERLNLSFFSYINAKISYLLIIILLQSFLYTIIGNSVLEISGMIIAHWGVYFSCGAAGIMLGLIYSSLHKSYESIQIKTIPITLLILLVLGGGIIPTKHIKNKDSVYTPILSDLVLNRWAYEAIVVKQFTNNPSEKHYFAINKQISLAKFGMNYTIPILKNQLKKLNNSSEAKPNHTALAIISNTLEKLEYGSELFPFEHQLEIEQNNINATILADLTDYISYLEYYYNNNYSEQLESKRYLQDSISTATTENIAIAKLVKNSGNKRSVKIYQNNIIPLKDQIYHSSDNNFGRGVMFIGQKKFNDQHLDTYSFNLSIIWVINILVYVLLITNIGTSLKKAIKKKMQ